MLIQEIIDIQLDGHLGIADLTAITRQQVNSGITGEFGSWASTSIGHYLAIAQGDAAAEVQALKITALDFKSAPKAAGIPGDAGQTVTNIKPIDGITCRIALRNLNIRIGPGGYDIPARQDFPGNVNFRSPAADFAERNTTITGASAAIVHTVRVPHRHIGLGQVVISQVGAQLAVEEFKLNPAFILCGAGGVDDFADPITDKGFGVADLSSKALRVIGV